MTAPVGRVLGTAVQAIEGDGPALLVSDLHLPATGGDELLARLQALLDTAVRDHLRVFVLGDLFDSYVSPAQLRVGVWREVAARLAAASRSVPVVVLHGNRDFLLGQAFARASGAHLVAGGVRTTVAGRRLLLLHGDELCLRDLPYQRAKRWLRSAPVRWLSRWLPLRAALWVARRARRKSAMVIAGGDQSRFDPTPAAVQQALGFGGGVDLLVFGHIHRPAQGRVGAAEYAVLPAFDAEGVAVVVAREGIRWWSPAGAPPGPPPPAAWLPPGPEALPTHRLQGGGAAG